MSLGLASGIFIALVLFKISGIRKFISLLIIISFLPFVSIFSTEIQSDFQILYKITIRLIILTLVIFYFIFYPKLFGFFTNRIYLPLYLLFFLSLLSCFYSFYEWWAFFRINEIIILFILFVIGFSILIREYKIENILWTFTLAIFLPVLLILILTFIDPINSQFVNNDGRIRLGHITLNSSSLGTLAAIVIFGCLFRIKRLPEINKKKEIVRKLQAYLILLASCYTLIFSLSRGALIGFLIALTLYYLLKSPIKKVFLKLSIILIIILLVVGIFTDELIDYLTRGEEIETLYSLTGRYYLWIGLIKHALNDFRFFGYGFLALSDEGVFYLENIKRINAHNTYINSFLYLGIPGFFINLFIHIYVTFKSLYFCMKFDRSDLRFDIALLVFCIYIILGIVGIVEAILMGWPNPMMAVFFLYLPVLAWLKKS